jgi:hypothetical protein
MDEMNKILTKNFDSLNVHQAGPNEYFWDFVTQKVNEEGYEAKTKQQ